MKQILIENCMDCPHASERLIFDAGNISGWCKAVEKRKPLLGRELKNATIIPSWCPLDDVPENAAMQKRAGNIKETL